MVATLGRPRRDREGEDRRAAETLARWRAEGPTLFRRHFSRREKEQLLRLLGRSEHAIDEVASLD